MPRFNSGELENIETRLRGLEKKMDKLYRQVNPVALPSLDDVDKISIGNEIYIKQERLLYQTKKDGIVRDVQGDTTYGHKVLSLKEDGKGKKSRVARPYYDSKYATAETRDITWSILDGEVAISDV